MAHSVEFENLCNDAKQRITETSIAEVRTRQLGKQPFLLIDVREDHEWMRGHIAGAVHLGRGILERDIIEQVPDKTAEIVLYCGGGYRSALAADNLQRMGYRNVYSMAGGWRGWTGQGLPVE